MARLNVYVDGFNLYFGMLDAGTTQFPLKSDKSIPKHVFNSSCVIIFSITVNLSIFILFSVIINFLKPPEVTNLRLNH